MATAQELAAELYRLRSQIATLQREAGEVEAALVAEMTEKQLEIPGLGVFERRRKTDRKAWQHEDIRSALLVKLREGEIEPARYADLVNGEIIEEDETELAFRVLTECANPSWRVTALKRYDIDPDDFCEVTPGGYSIQFHGELEGAAV
jgi:hypothetical protein